MKRNTAILLLFAAGFAWGQKPPADPKPVPAKVVFVKEFPGSYPDYYSISLSADGQARYATAPDDTQPVEFRLPETLVAQIFQVVARLDYLKDARLESSRKVAFMGKKTIRYEAGGQRQEAAFNYSENADAMALVQVFEKISSTEQHLLNLERLARFDRLGVNKELLQIEIAMNARELIEPAQLAPLLEQIAANTHYLNIARDRATEILQRIRKGDYSPNINLAPAPAKP